MVILNVGEIYSLNSMAKALFKAGLQDALLKYNNSLTMVILNVREIYSLNSMAKALFKAGLEDALLKYNNSLTVNESSSIWNKWGFDVAK